VHSLEALNRSRSNCQQLLRAFPEHEQFSRTEMARKLLEQELKLQESIRTRDYADREVAAKIRRYLAPVFGGTGLLVVICSLVYAYYHRADANMVASMLGWSKWVFWGSAVPVAAYYFPDLARKYLSRK